MKIHFFGATKTVTGSCFLLEADGHQILIDCGFFQEYDKEYLNYEPFPFNPKKLKSRSPYTRSSGSFCSDSKAYQGRVKM